ncbi:hypothetical protein DPMN_021534 [Dreissena polymorpha]|uniref:Uncharacterized protein n=1 Tax=Dreissena polymorpha TaxID=45954 RepID=A0A9D4SA16_DREPO|nr:hypothetical protein DPMN_021534 [Dreissena polymorpha]
MSKINESPTVLLSLHCFFTCQDFQSDGTLEKPSNEVNRLSVMPERDILPNKC